MLKTNPSSSEGPRASGTANGATSTPGLTGDQGEPVPRRGEVLVQAATQLRDVAVQNLLRPAAFLGEVTLAGLATALGRGQLRAADVVRVLADTSARSLPIVLVVNVLIGAILAFVGAVQLVKFGAGIFVADLVTIAVVREMAAVITAVVMSGRIGAAFAAELATMQANEEIDAFEVMGLHAVDYLVLPRVASLMLMLPLLYVFASIAGVLGGLVVGVGMLDISGAAYLDRVAAAFSWGHAGLGVAKAWVFGVLVALAACYQGLHAPRTAAGVGAAATRAVVISIVAIIAADAVFAVCANALGV